ncbi:MAG: hypothetical protein O2840_03475 [bacterium]|nr:hypothetical protein [bacterium]
MQRGLVTLTNNESQAVKKLIQANESSPVLLQQKFANVPQETASYELSADEVNWVLDRLPIPQEANEVASGIREKLQAFLTQT